MICLAHSCRHADLDLLLLQADWSLTAILTFGGMEYSVLVLSDDAELIRRKIYKSTTMRLIVHLAFGGYRVIISWERKNTVRLVVRMRRS